MFPTSSDSNDSCAVPWSAANAGVLRRRLQPDYWQQQSGADSICEPDTPASGKSVTQSSGTESMLPWEESTSLMRRRCSHASINSASGTSECERVVFQAKPLFSHPYTVYSVIVDIMTWIWASICHSIITAWPYVSLILLAGAVCSNVLRYVAIVAFSSLLLPRCPFVWPVIAVLDRLFFVHWRRHSSYKLTYDASINASEQYILAEFPHGVYPLGGQLHASVWPQLHLGRLYLLAADVLFLVPMWRHYMSVGGAASATAESMHALLKAGHSIAVHVGGIAEMFEVYPDREVIHLSKRRGFVRAAVQHGVPIIPMYHFGNTQILSFFPRILQPLSRRLRISLGIFCGQLGLPIPKQRPIWTVAGRPVDVGSGMSPLDPGFEDCVEEKHAEFQEALQNLYEQHKCTYHDGVRSWADRPLQIK